MYRFYNPDAIKDQMLDEFESRHATRVLRLNTGDQIEVIDGKGNLHLCEISEISKKTCHIHIIRSTHEDPACPNLHIAVAPTKSNDRFEWFLEKATEVGITHITPVLCSNSERNKIKPERYEKVIVAALKQSKRLYKPVLNPVTSIAEFMEQTDNSQLKAIAHCDDDQEKRALKTILQKGNPATILIGPEGDFTQSEVSQAHAKGFKSVSLGKNRLRTETAAIVACHTFQLINE